MSGASYYPIDGIAISELGARFPYLGLAGETNAKQYEIRLYLIRPDLEVYFVNGERVPALPNTPTTRELFKRWNAAGKCHTP